MEALHGWTRFVSMQNQYNLMRREEEREMSACSPTKASAASLQPACQGRLARPWGERTHRMDNDPVGRRFDNDNDRPIIDAVKQVAQARGIPMAQVALAWVLKHPLVSAPIVGPTKEHHLTDAVSALDIHLTDEEAIRLEEPHLPHLPTRF